MGNLGILKQQMCKCDQDAYMQTRSIDNIHSVSK